MATHFPLDPIAKDQIDEIRSGASTYTIKAVADDHWKVEGVPGFTVDIVEDSGTYRVISISEGPKFSYTFSSWTEAMAHGL